MALIGPEGAINELPPPWRRVAYAALIAISITAAYFMFVAGPVADAQQVAASDGKRIDKVERDISQIKGDVSDIRAQSASRDQKIDDMKETVGQINQKLDRLIERSSTNRTAPQNSP